MTLRLFLRTEAGHGVGLGHLFRCIHHAKVAEKEDIKTTLLIQSKLDVLNEVLKPFDLDFEVLPEAIEAEISIWKEQTNHQDCNILLFDLSNQRMRARIDYFNKLLENSSKMFSKSIVLDGMGPDLLANKLEGPFDAHILPYVGAESFTGLFSAAHSSITAYYGPEYYVPPYNHERYRSQQGAKKLETVFLSMGGSDPSGSTTNVLSQLITLEDIKKIFVIVGPAFSEDQVDQLKIIQNSDIRIDLIFASTNLLEYIASSDLCVISSGLTKYEVALMGKPSIHVAINRQMQESNREFLRKLNIPEIESGNEARITNEVLNYLRNPCIFMSAARDASRVIDTRGGERFCAILHDMSKEAA